MRRLARILALLAAAAVLSACWIYSFSGTSIDPSVKTITIDYLEYKALRVNPSLSNDLTEGLKEKFRKMTRLTQVDLDGDLEISGEITGYDVRSQAVTAQEVAAQNRLTVSVKINYMNRIFPDEDFERSVSAYADYDSSLSLDAVEATLCEEIIEKLCEDILNATVANW